MFGRSLGPYFSFTYSKSLVCFYLKLNIRAHFSCRPSSLYSITCWSYTKKLKSIKHWHYFVIISGVLFDWDCNQLLQEHSSSSLVLVPQCTLRCKSVRYPSTAGYFDSLNPISLMNNKKQNDLFQFCMCKRQWLNQQKELEEKLELHSEEW